MRRILSGKGSLLAATLVTGILSAANASADVIISEVDPAGSGGSTYAADWFELTNTGSSSVDVSGWKVDDDSNSFSSALALRNVTSIAAGQTVVFLDDSAVSSKGPFTTDAALDAAFDAAWFGNNVPSNLVIGNYGGSGIGLGQGGDQVHIFNQLGVAQAGVTFGAVPSGGATFDNSAGLNNATLTTASVVGTDGAFASVAGAEVGSPGVDVAPVPLPAAAWLLISGLGLLPAVSRRSKIA